MMCSYTLLYLLGRIIKTLYHVLDEDSPQNPQHVHTLEDMEIEYGDDVIQCHTMPQHQRSYVDAISWQASNILPEKLYAQFTADLNSQTIHVFDGENMEIDEDEVLQSNFTPQRGIKNYALNGIGNAITIMAISLQTSDILPEKLAIQVSSNLNPQNVHTLEDMEIDYGDAVLQSHTMPQHQRNYGDAISWQASNILPEKLDAQFTYQKQNSQSIHVFEGENMEIDEDEALQSNFTQQGELTNYVLNGIAIIAISLQTSDILPEKLGIQVSSDLNYRGTSAVEDMEIDNNGDDFLQSPTSQQIKQHRSHHVDVLKEMGNALNRFTISLHRSNILL